MNFLITNDWHLGTMRAGGTTPNSAFALLDHLSARHDDLVQDHLDKHLVINGDLFDKFDVTSRTVVDAYRILDTWCANSDFNARLFLLGGNHDISAKGDKISSFELLCNFLKSKHSHKVFVALHGGVHNLDGSLWAIPHCMNQDIFDLELERALAEIEGPATLLLHCNYDNNHAARADHSLNISAECAQEFTRKGIRLVLGHEHNKRVLQKGMVYITGNQVPSSVLDCLDDHGVKEAHILHAEDGHLEAVPVTHLNEVFTVADWKDLADLEGYQFIRVAGKCSAEQAPDMLRMISKLRQKSDAFVIANAVVVEGVGSLEGLDEVSFEQVKQFDVLGELCSLLEPAEAKVVRQLMENKNAPD